ncbi:hypothetical protein [Eisenbergiella porci]|uniref:hypothetical protein n=1 Tax=Eisenbergiella porci TaxID=2652274 RepID=UPI002A8311D4|nr:hypothetical protein [Eisenbergiella porci]
MNKIRFANDIEMEVAGVSQAGDSLQIELETTDVNAAINSFRNNAAATSRMRYYVGADLLRGYTGYTKLVEVEFQPDVVTGIDYEIEDGTTESGFSEIKMDKVTVSMKRVDKVAQVAAAAEQLAANLDYVAMETGVEI